MLEGWKFPSEIVDVVLLHHHDVDVAAQDEDMRRVVLLAGDVAESLAGDPRRAQAALSRYEERAAAWFDLRRGTAMAALRSITDHAAELGRLFELDADVAPDIDGLLEEADRRRRTMRVDVGVMDDALDRDPITGLCDRNVFQRELLDQHESVESMAILLVGVDGMRELNNEGGPGTGDAALGRAAEAVMRATRDACGEQASVYRFVGAELAVMVRGDAVARAEALAERVRAAVRLAPFTDDSLGLRSLGVSIGVSSRHLGSGPESPDELLRAAMMAVSEARRSGGDSIVVWSDGEAIPLAA